MLREFERRQLEIMEQRQIDNDISVSWIDKKLIKIKVLSTNFNQNQSFIDKFHFFQEAVLMDEIMETE